MIQVVHVSEGGSEGGVYIGPGSPLWRESATGYERWVTSLPPDSPGGLKLRGLVKRARQERVRLMTPDLNHPVPYLLANLVARMAGRNVVQRGYSRAAFLDALHRAAPLQAMVAAYLRAHGIRAYAEPYTVVPDDEEAVRSIGATGFDVAVWWRGRWTYLEVKGTSVAFNSPQDYPYPTAILDTKASCEAKVHKPFAYVIVSRPTGAMMAVPYGVPLFPRRLRDGAKGIEDTFLLYWLRDARPMSWLVEALTGTEVDVAYG